MRVKVKINTAERYTRNVSNFLKLHYDITLGNKKYNDMV